MSSAFEFSIPVKIIFGPGKLAEAGAQIAGLGRKALLVCGAVTAKSGLAERVRNLATAAGVEVTLYTGSVPNPTTDSIDAGAAVCRKAGCDVVVGLGGGSAIDTAKAIAVAATHNGPIWPYAMGEKAVTAATLPVVAITTTSGTGSHCTCFSVITNPKTNQKPGLGSPHILPRVAVVDPGLMLSAPPALTLVTGFDVFAHAVEAYTSKAANPLSDMFAEQAITLLARNLPTAYRNGTDIEARSAMALADTCAGVAICHAVVSLGHVMAHVISGHFHDIAHGDALFCVYRGVLAHNAAALPEKHAWIAGQLVPGCQDVVKAFDTFFAPFPFENRLKSKFLGSDQIAELAQETFTYMKGITELNPVKADVEDARRILVSSLQ